jgi:hypothetical protein
MSVYQSACLLETKRMCIKFDIAHSQTCRQNPILVEIDQHTASTLNEA